MDIARGGETVKRVNAILAWGLAAVFLASGFLKVADVASFGRAVDSFAMLPHAGVTAAAFFLPWLEIFSGVSLFFSKWRRAGLILVFLQLIIFMAVLSWALTTGKAAECGCFGKWGGGGSIQGALIRDAILLAAVIWLLRRCESGRFQVVGQVEA